MPNALRVPVNLSHAVEGYSMNLTFHVSKLKRFRAFGGEGYFLQRHQEDAILGPIEISQLKFPLGELRIPPDAVEKFVDRDHVMRPLRTVAGFRSLVPVPRCCDILGIWRAW